MADDMITAKAALDLLSEDGSDRATAANALRDYAAGGAIHATAETAIEIEGCGFSNGSSGGRESARHADWPIPATVWSSVERVFPHDLKGWSTGSFGANTGYNKAVRLSGVRFDRAAIIAFRSGFGPFRDVHRDQLNEKLKAAPASLVASPAPIGRSPTTASRGGHPGKMAFWHRFWMEAMTMLNEGELEDDQRFPTQKSLMDELRRRINDGLSEESVKPHISKIWLKFVNRGG